MLLWQPAWPGHPRGHPRRTQKDIIPEGYPVGTRASYPILCLRSFESELGQRNRTVKLTFSPFPSMLVCMGHGSLDIPEGHPRRTSHKDIPQGHPVGNRASYPFFCLRCGNLRAN